MLSDVTYVRDVLCFFYLYFIFFFFFLMIRRPPRSTLFPYTTLFRSVRAQAMLGFERFGESGDVLVDALTNRGQDRKSTRLNSSHPSISYAVFCLKKKKIKIQTTTDIRKKNNEPPMLLVCTCDPSRLY